MRYRRSPLGRSSRSKKLGKAHEYGESALQKPSGKLSNSRGILVRNFELARRFAAYKNGDAQVENGSTSILDILIDVSSLYSFEKEFDGATMALFIRQFPRTMGAPCLKKMMKTKLNKRKAEMFRKEVAIMRMMDCPNIIKLHGCYEDSEAVYLAQEMALVESSSMLLLSGVRLQNVKQPLLCKTCSPPSATATSMALSTVTRSQRTFFSKSPLARASQGRRCPSKNH